MTRTQKKTIKNEEGSALVLAMMVLLVLSVLGATLGVVTIGSYRLGHTNQETNSAYYIAQAGANMAYEEIKTEVDKAYGVAKQSNSESNFFHQINNSDIVKTGKINKPAIYSEGYFNTQSSNQPEAEIRVVEQGKSSEEDSTYEYIIQSTGKVDGKTRTVEKPIEVTWRSHVLGEGEAQLWTANAALIFKDTVRVPLSTLTVHGDIVYDINATNPFRGLGIVYQPERRITGWWGIIPIYELTGYTREPEDLNWDKYDTIINRFPEEPNYSKVIRGSYFNSNILINENTYIPNLRSALFKNITVDTNGKEINIVVDDLELNGGTNIEVLGSGTVNFFVKDNMKFNGIGSINRRHHESQLNFLYAGDNKVIFNGGFNLNASIFVKKADIEINGATVVTDGIISGGESISLVGGHILGGMVYAPYASINVTGGTGVDGIVLAESLNVFGLSVIDYNGDYVEDFYYYSDNAEIEPTIDDLITSEPAIER